MLEIFKWRIHKIWHLWPEVQHVRRAAVSALSTAAHNKPGLVQDLLPTLLPLLYDQTVVKVCHLWQEINYLRIFGTLLYAFDKNPAYFMWVPLSMDQWFVILYLLHVLWIAGVYPSVVLWHARKKTEEPTDRTASSQWLSNRCRSQVSPQTATRRFQELELVQNLDLVENRNILQILTFGLFCMIGAERAD